MISVTASAMIALGPFFATALAAPSLQREATDFSTTTARLDKKLSGLLRQASGAGACQGGDQYMCLDWSFGSAVMGEAQAAYAPETFFVVGSYEGSGNLGKCYKFNTTSSNYTFIGQAINEGEDINSGQFDIQTGAGGFGLFNACTSAPGENTTASGSAPMFDVGAEKFGETFGGVQTVEDCDDVPEFPAEGTPPSTAVPVSELCKRAFEWGGRNGDITQIERISCPQELVNVTGLRRDDDSDFTDNEEGSSGYTTTTMDCCKPAAAFPLTEDGSARFDADSDYPYVRACQRDGYTRV